MARIRPGGTRQVRQPINPNLPDTGPVMVDVSGAGNEKPALIYGSSAYAAPPDNLKPSHTVALDQPPEQPPITALPLDHGEDDPEVSLRKTRERVKSRREQSLEAQNQELQNWGTRQAQEAAVAKHEVIKSNYDTVSSALGQAEADLQASKRQYAEAWQKGDGMGVADAQAAIADAQYRINTLRAGKDELEQAARTPPQVAAPPPTAASANVEKILAQLTNLRPDEKDWIRQHPEAVEQHNQLHLRAAFEASQRKGLTRGSPEYFQFLNERMEFEDGGDAGGEPEFEEEPVVEQPRRQEPRQRFAAAPSRNGGSAGNLPPGKIMLSEAQRQVARLSMPGLPPAQAEFEYAKGVARLINDKKSGLYPSG